MPKTEKIDPAPDVDADETPEWPKVVEWENRTFTIPNPEDWPLGALRAFETGRQVDAIARVLGDAAWAQVEDMPTSKTRPLFDLIAEAAGFTNPGE